MIKKTAKFIIPSKAWNILRYIKHNPNAVRQGWHVLKKQGVKALLGKIKKAEQVPLRTLIYTYIEPKLTDAVQKKMDSFTQKPLISIIMPVYNVDSKWLDLAIKSIESQWYENWELCIADDKSTNKKTIDYLKSINNPKIKIKFLEKNLNISGASNEALELSCGEYIALMDNDDEITPDALYEVVKVINEKDAEFIYSDEDKLEMNGDFSDPHFKPNFAPDLFLSQNYISHLGVIKKDLIVKVGGFTIGLEGAQDYDLYLKVLEYTNKIYHIPKVLYHWRKIPGSTAAEFSDKSYAQDAGLKALENYIKLKNLDATVSNGQTPGTYKVFYKIKDEPLVSIIIPFKDQPKLLKQCIKSILKKSTYKNYQIIGISNNSREKEVFMLMEQLKKEDSRIEFYKYDIPFNYSKINNYALKYCKGEHIVFLNNDVEIISENWIEELLTHSQRSGVGAVGAKLYFPNNRVQHAGIAIVPRTIHGVILLYQGHHRESYGYISRLKCINNYSAVTAACLMVKKDKFIEVGMFDEEKLQIAFNDVDLCLKLQESGYRNIFTPYCEAYHYESASRGYDECLEKLERIEKEKFNLKEKHKQIFNSYDPFYSKNLSLSSVSYDVSNENSINYENFIGIKFSEDILYKKEFSKIEKKEICIFSHFDEKGRIGEDILFFLESLQKIADIIFVSTSDKLLDNTSEINKLAKICTSCIVKANYGYDFGSWKTGINFIKQLNIDFNTLLLCNDSVLGPLFDLEEIFYNMQKKNYDVWSMTDNYEIDYHLQSYFVVYNKNCIESKIFKNFWTNFKIYKDKQTLIKRNEILYSRSLIESGLNIGVFCSAKNYTFVNMLHYYWKDIIVNKSFPFIKKELIRDNPKNIDISQLETIIKENTNYNYNLINKYLERINEKHN